MNEFEFSPEGFQGLEAFENPDQSRRYEIEFTCPEWTALCPRSGFPDFGTIHIRYVPRQRCVELKSLKLYINAYRDVKIFHEHVVNVILEDFVAACDPVEVLLEGDFNVRGNIKTTVRAEYKKSGVRGQESE